MSVCSLCINELISLLQDVKGLSLILSVQQQARRLEHHDLLASLILGTFELTEEEKPFIKALEEKYDMLSQVLLMHDLKCEIGIAWDRWVRT